MSITKVTYSMIASAPENVVDRGADPTGNMDSTLAIQNALNQGGNIYFPPGVYKVTGILSLISGTTIFAENATISYAPTPASITYIFDSLNVSDICVNGLKFVATSQFITGFIFRHGVNIEINDCKAENCCLVKFTTTAANYGAVVIDPTDVNFNGSYDCRVLNCTVLGANRTDVNIAIYMEYCVNWSVDNCFIRNCYWGVLWWGGDSNPAINGAFANDRKCKKGSVTNCKIVQTNAGIWGSMGQDISVASNSVEDADDVCLDAEGSFEVVFQGNNVANGVNGCLATFWYNRGIKFIGNTVRIDDSSYTSARIYNASLSAQYNLDISFIGNTFICLSGLGVVSDGSGPARHVLFADNEMINVCVKFKSLNAHIIDVLDNNFTFSNDTGAPFQAIEVHGGYQYINPGVTNVIGNTIQAEFSVDSSSYAIYALTYDTNAASQVLISENSVMGFLGATELCVQEVSSNAGFGHSVRIRNNYLQHGLYLRVIGASFRSVVLLEGNTKQINVPYPDATPVSGYWNAGQIAQTSAPLSGGYIGAVCVSSGTPGIWKNWGAIS